ncbi:MAG: exopolyphosphatase [Nitrospinae bacterium RIFCSPLOWO2_12_FULL_47_7]|nr:MAG: exopolyphosphatase [Nitrospinae bacterium RIFCSPLOWO2_12_FULL_47_7]
MKKAASIDIGSNTLRLLILETNAAGEFREVDTDRAITRLGEGMDTQKRLLEHRIRAALDVLVRFRDKCRSYGDVPIYVVATSAVREASNREEFIKRVLEKTGMVVEVIPWEEEARLTLKGVFWKIPDAGKATLTFDIGGGSTEFILSKGREFVASAGTLLGVVRLTEKFITRHPVDAEEYEKLEKHIHLELQAVKSALLSQPEVLIGTAGTVTTVAALDKNIFPYDPLMIHNTALKLERIQVLFNDLKKKTLEERLRYKALERGREDVIIAGMAVILETMRIFGCESLTVSEYSLREGILLKALNAVK